MTTAFTSLLPDLKTAFPAGFAIALHIRFTSPAILLQAYAPDWIEAYNREGMVMQDPTVRWGLRNSGIIRWQELPDIDAAGEHVLRAAAEHGLIHGFCVGVGQPGSRSVASFARQDRPATDTEMAAAHDTVAQLHAITTDGMMPSAEERTELARLSILLTTA